ncbi:MAG TPA: MBL fold metallo-hydrolase [Humisphaera sp.]
MTQTTRRGFLAASAAAVAAFAVPSRFASAADAPAAADAKASAAPATAPVMFGGRIEAVKVADDLVVFAGAGGNAAACFDAGRVLLVDSGVPFRAAEMLKLVTALAPEAKARTLFNTHWHYDHTGGNDAFAAAGFAVVGTVACRQRMGQKVNFQDLAMVMEPTPERTWPTVTFEEKLTLFAGAEPVRLIKWPASHTDTDAVAYFEKHNVLHTGDVLVSGGYPVIDRATGGSLDGMIAATKQLTTVGDAKTRIIPGHGPVGGREMIQTQLDLLNLVRDRLAPLAERKLTIDEVLKLAPLADLDEKWGRGFLRSPVFTRMAYGQWTK